MAGRLCNVCYLAQNAVSASLWPRNWLAPRGAQIVQIVSPAKMAQKWHAAGMCMAYFPGLITRIAVDAVFTWNMGGETGIILAGDRQAYGKNGYGPEGGL